MYEGEAWDSDRLLLRYMNVTPSEEEAQAAAAGPEQGTGPNAPSFFHLSERAEIKESDGPPTERHSVDLMENRQEVKGGLLN